MSENGWRDHVVAGGISGLLADCVLHPFDTLKTKIQAQTVTSSGNTLRVIRSIASTEGVRGFYAGFTPAIIGSFPACSVYFLTYNTIKNNLAFLNSPKSSDPPPPPPHSDQNNNTGEKRKKITAYSPLETAELETLVEDQISGGSPLVHFLAGAGGDISASFINVPLEVIKSRMQVSGAPPIKPSAASAALSQSNAANIYHYSGILDGAKSIFRSEGMPGLYRGYASTMLRDCFYSGFLFVFYEPSKAWVLHSNKTQDLTFSQSVAISCFCATAAAALTTPFDFLKTRIQIATKLDTPPKILPTLRHVIKTEGFRALFRGIGPRILTLTPSTALTLAVYEKALSWLRNNEKRIAENA